MKEKFELALIYASTADGRSCDTVAAWIAAQIWNRGDFSLHMVNCTQDAYGHGEGALRFHVRTADAFVIVAAQDDHGNSAMLESLIDSTDQGWRAKPAAFVSYGGVFGEQRVTEQLRLVLAGVEAVTIRDCVRFGDVSKEFDAAGELLRPNPASEAAATMLARLKWWASALRDARRSTPYGQLAA